MRNIFRARNTRPILKITTLKDENGHNQIVCTIEYLFGSFIPGQLNSKTYRRTIQYLFKCFNSLSHIGVSLSRLSSFLKIQRKKLKSPT